MTNKAINTVASWIDNTVKPRKTDKSVICYCEIKARDSQKTPMFYVHKDGRCTVTLYDMKILPLEDYDEDIHKARIDMRDIICAYIDDENPQLSDEIRKKFDD